MKKTFIILSVFALIVSGCAQTTKQTTETNEESVASENQTVDGTGTHADESSMQQTSEYEEDYGPDVKTGTKKARIPYPDEYSYSDLEYTYHINSEDKLTGVNTFSVVFLESPVEGALIKYFDETLRTGKETLKIICDPKNTGNRTITYTNTVQFWYFDKVSLTWKKDPNEPNHPL